MSGGGPAARRPTHAELATATHPRRDGSPYAQTQAGFWPAAAPTTRRRLLAEVPPR